MTATSARGRMIAINGFREEAARLEALGLLHLDGETRSNIRRYHDEVLEDLGAGAEAGLPRPVHWGMRAVATAGAAVLAGLGLWSLDALWPELGLAARLAIALALPIALWLLAEALHAAMPSRYPALVAATLAAVSLCGAAMVAGVAFNRPAGGEALLLGGAAAALLGLRLGSLALAGAGMSVALAALTAMLALYDGAVSGALWMRLDLFPVAGIVAFLLGAFLPAAPPLPAALRLSGLLTGGLALAGLGPPGASLVDLPAYVWPLAGGGLLALAYVAGLRRDWPETRMLAPLLLASTAAFALWRTLDGRIHETAAWLLAGLVFALLAGALTLARRRLEGRP